METTVPLHQQELLFTGTGAPSADKQVLRLAKEKKLRRITGTFLGRYRRRCATDTAFMDRIHAFVPGWDFLKLNKSYFTTHFGLVSDFLAGCWTQLRNSSRISSVLPRLDLGGALNGRDTTAVHKTINGLLKLMQPSPDEPVSDELLEWATKLALEYRRRVKEQQKRIGSAEFRNTHFSYRLGADAVEIFVTTPEIHSENTIGEDPQPPGQIWTLNTGSGDDPTGLYKIEVSFGPSSGLSF